MASSDIRDLKLVELYHRYVGEPSSKRDVYGYWLFLLGSLAGLVGVLVYQVEQALFPGNFEIRQVAIVLAAIGLALAVLGIVVLLPVRRRGMQASVVGLLIAVGGIAAFVWAYPWAWYVTEIDYSAEIIAVYSLGVGIIVAVAILVPVVTGEKGLLVEPELGLGEDDPPILVGDVQRDAFFSVYRTPSKEWTWRTIQRDAVGQSARTTATDTDARMDVEAIREQIAGAGLLDITTAAFRLYRTEDDAWQWSLVEDDGGIVGRSADPYGDRDSIESAVNFMKEATADAGIVEIRGAAIDVYADEGGRWHWRFVDDRRRPLATSVDAYPDEGTAEASAETFAAEVEEPRVLALESVGVELYEDLDGELDDPADVDDGEAVVGDGGDGTRGQWRWRVIDGDDRRLVASEATFHTRGDAEDAATDVVKRLDDAALVEHGTSGYEVYRVGDEWRWRLRDRADDIVAAQYGRSGDEAAARALAERTGAALGDAEVIEFEGVDYEVYPGDGEWHWRLVSEDRETLADSTVPAADREEAEEAVDQIREQALAADLIEFEQAAFQQYESDGEWRWRLIDEDGKVMADSGESYEDKAAVMEGMRTLKENAPDAEVLEIDTAAFEIYLAEDGDYAWRLIDEGGRLVAESADSYPSRAAARDAVDFVLEHVETAGVRTMETAVFQLSSDDGTWGFWLVAVDGTILAEGVDDHSTRDDAREATAAVQRAGDDAPVDVFGPVTIQLRGGSDPEAGWHFRLIDRDRELVAEGRRTYEDRETALADVERLREGAASAPVFEVGDGIVWVDRTGDGWRWRLVDADRTELGVGPHTFDDREGAIEAVETVKARAPEAGRFEIDTLAFEPYLEPVGGVGGGENGADGDGEDAEREASWHWRLLDERESVLGESAVGYASREAVVDAIDDVRSTTTKASILEIDEVTFEFAERDGGWVWRLIDEHGEPLAESVQPHDTRRAAREEMLVVKEYAPEGETVVAW